MLAMLRLYTYAVIINLLHSLQLVDYHGQFEIPSEDFHFNLNLNLSDSHSQLNLPQSQPQQQKQSCHVYRFESKLPQLSNHQQQFNLEDFTTSNSNYVDNYFCCRRFNPKLIENFNLLNPEQFVLLRLFQQLACSAIGSINSNRKKSFHHQFPIRLFGELENDSDLNDLRLVVDRLIQFNDYYYYHHQNIVTSSSSNKLNLEMKSMQNVLIKFGNTLQKFPDDDLSDIFNNNKNKNKSISVNQPPPLMLNQISLTQSFIKNMAAFVVFVLLSVLMFYIGKQVLNCLQDWPNIKLTSILSLVNVLFLPLYYQFNLVFNYFNLFDSIETDSSWLFRFLFASSVALNLFVLVRFLLSFADFSFHYTDSTYSVPIAQIVTPEVPESLETPIEQTKRNDLTQYTQIKPKSSNNIDLQLSNGLITSQFEEQIESMNDFNEINETTTKNIVFDEEEEDEDENEEEMLDYEKMTAEIEEIFNSAKISDDFQASCSYIDNNLKAYIDNNSSPTISPTTRLFDEFDRSLRNDLSKIEEEDDSDEDVVDTYEIDEIIDESIKNFDNKNPIRRNSSTSTICTLDSDYLCSSRIHQPAKPFGLDRFANLLQNHHQLYPKDQSQSIVNYLAEFADYFDDSDSDEVD